MRRRDTPRWGRTRDLTIPASGPLRWFREDDSLRACTPGMEPNPPHPVLPRPRGGFLEGPRPACQPRRAGAGSQTGWNRLRARGAFHGRGPSAATAPDGAPAMSPAASGTPRPPVSPYVRLAPDESRSARRILSPERTGASQPSPGQSDFLVQRPETPFYNITAAGAAGFLEGLRPARQPRRAGRAPVPTGGPCAGAAGFTLPAGRNHGRAVHLEPGRPPAGTRPAEGAPKTRLARRARPELGDLADARTARANRATDGRGRVRIPRRAQAEAPPPQVSPGASGQF